MPFDTKILGDKIDKLKETFESGQFADALVTALDTGNGLLQQRIFTQNEDVNGNSLGTYIGKKGKVRLKVSANKTQNKRNKAIAGLSLTSYQRKRAAAGRQILKKDLEFSGGLRRSIETQIENEKAAVLQFNNSEAAQIAHGQEQQINRIMGTGKIFSLNASEKDEVNEQALLLINQILKP